MAHDARSVANELIRRAREEEHAVTPMQVLKLTYLCHAWMLGLYGRPLFRQQVEAWMYGPVVGDVYGSLKQYGGSPIRTTIKLMETKSFDEYEKDLIEQVWRRYGNLSGPQLSAMTHAPGTPWSIVRHRPGRRSANGRVIPDNLIQRHYESKIAKSDDND